jgi:hypothetical protein
MNKNIAKILLVGAVLVALFLARGSRAAGGDFSISFFPQYPSPGAEVTARLKSYSFDPNRAEIVWLVDGKVLAKGVGGRDFKFIAPDFGKEKKIDVYVSTLEGIISSSSFKFTGNDVDLLWQAMTTVPLWYKGKAMPSVQSQIKMTAKPYLFSGGALISDSNLVYEWSVNFKKDINKSGMGKNYFLFKIKDNSEDYIISIRVSSKDGLMVFEKSMTFSTTDIDPKFVFYKEDILNGTQYNEAFPDNFQLNEDELILKAEPFFFSKENAGNLSYSWTMNGEGIQSQDKPNIVDLRINPGSSGSAAIGLEIKNPFSMFQSAVKSLNINYGQ